MTDSRKTKAQLQRELEDMRREMDRMEGFKDYYQRACEVAGTYEGFRRAGYSREEAFALLIKTIEISGR